MSHPENFSDDEAFARMLQYEEEQQLVHEHQSQYQVTACPPATSEPADTGLYEPSTPQQHSASSLEQELQDLEIAREFIRLDLARDQGQQIHSPLPPPTVTTQAMLREERQTETIDKGRDSHGPSSQLTIDEYSRALQDSTFGPSGGISSSPHRRRSRSLDDSLEYARLLQEQAFYEVAEDNQRSEQETQQNQLSSSSLQSQSALQSAYHETDVEMARRMQEMEDQGLSTMMESESERLLHELVSEASESTSNMTQGHRSSGERLEGSLGGNNPFESSYASRLSQQEEEDEKLARFLQNSGASLRDLSYDAVSGILDSDSPQKHVVGTSTSSVPSFGAGIASNSAHRDQHGSQSQTQSSQDLTSTHASSSSRNPLSFDPMGSHRTIEQDAKSGRSEGQILPRHPPTLDHPNQKSSSTQDPSRRGVVDEPTGYLSNPLSPVPVATALMPPQLSVSAPSTPTGRASSTDVPAKPSVAMPVMSSLDDSEANFGVSVIRSKEKRKKRGWFGNRQERNLPPTSPTRNITAPSASSSGTVPSVPLAKHPLSPARHFGKRSAGGPHSLSPAPVTPVKAAATISAPRTPVSSRATAAATSPSRTPTRKPTPRSLSPHSLGGISHSMKPGPPAPQLSVKKGASPNTQSQICVSCGRSGGSFVVALDKRYHVDCFRCVSCHERIDTTAPFAFHRDDNGVKRPLHRTCYEAMYGIKCAVCDDKIPYNDDGTVSFVKHPFFDTEQMCPWHAETPGRRCAGCHRFEPRNAPFADLNDADRCVCYACCRTVIVDNADVQPIWERVLSFFEHTLKLTVWKEMREIAILVVQSDALNDQMDRGNNPHKGSSQIMASGLCLTDHECGSSVFKLPALRYEKSSSSFEALDGEDRGFTYFDVSEDGTSNPHANVFAILCLSGLPRDLTASILAHEATHAWIKLHPNYNARKPLPPQVEEGCAQLVAMLLLTDGLEPPKPLSPDDSLPSDEKLRQYFKFAIERDDNEIYGTGYRKAAVAYSDIGIEALLSHVVRYREFPST